MVKVPRLRYASAVVPLVVKLAAPSIILCTLAAPGGADTATDNRAPQLGSCQHLQVEAGNKVAFHVYAEGVQIYRWDGLAWIFEGPEAVLFVDAGGNGEIGIHYAGPTWESVSGSTVRAWLLTAAHRIPMPFLGFCSKR